MNRLSDAKVKFIQRALVPSMRSQVEPFIAMDVLSTARQMERAGLSIVHMEMG